MTEELNEYQKRVHDFLNDYKLLTEKYEIDLAPHPVFTPDGAGGFKVIIQSTPVDLKLAKLNDSFIKKNV